MNIGVALLPKARGHGFGGQAVGLLMEWAFRKLGCHSIEARNIDGDDDCTDVALGMFTGLGFAYEGKSHRAVLHIVEPPPGAQGAEPTGEWRDVMNLVMLDTDWECISLRSMTRTMLSRWEDLFARHMRLREEMLRLEERCGRRAQKLKRAASTETLHSAMQPPENILEKWSGFLSGDAVDIELPSHLRNANGGVDKPATGVKNRFSRRNTSVTPSSSDTFTSRAC
ncbi:hypothetical protein EW026_g5756 [Hermanssonia centrifuga]|uniref:N-acetyltransferase domain-containing protein n=1 Tax=Hermanssonia centrifuga TaxID=98765 RepID=A0A4V3X9Y8_9APHY|nr:hypothetical protein EW026_g5756 [Hermanssonia centrifuga]